MHAGVSHRIEAAEPPRFSRIDRPRAPVLGPWEKVEGAHTGGDRDAQLGTRTHPRGVAIASFFFSPANSLSDVRLQAPRCGTRGIQGGWRARNTYIQRASCADAFRGRFILVTFRAVLLARVNPLRSSSDTLGDIRQSSVTAYACAHLERHARSLAHDASLERREFTEEPC